MRTWFVLGSAFTLAVGLMGACGGTSDSNPSDAGAGDATLDVTPVVDATTDGPKDAAADSAKCDLSEDFTTKIPDASLDDGGPRSTGLCLACLKVTDNCKANIDQCNANCECKSIIGEVLTCVGSGTDPFSCAAKSGISPASPGAQVGIGLLTCAQKKCGDECIPSSLKDASLDGTSD
jgi:hypothetical protein